MRLFSVSLAKTKPCNPGSQVQSAPARSYERTPGGIAIFLNVWAVSKVLGNLRDTDTQVAPTKPASYRFGSPDLANADAVERAIVEKNNYG
jgi:hypothetical protein